MTALTTHVLNTSNGIAEAGAPLRRVKAPVSWMKGKKAQRNSSKGECLSAHAQDA